MNEKKKQVSEDQDGLTQLLQVINSSSNEEKINEVTSSEQTNEQEEKALD